FGSAGERGFVWRAGVVTTLGLLAPDPDLFVLGVCGLGNAVVGTTQSGTGRAFRWRAAAGVQALPALTAGALSFGRACSAEGTVVVGTSGNGNKGIPPVRWDAAGVRSLGTLGGDSGDANAVSADGSVIVGEAGLPFTPDPVVLTSDMSAFRWTAGKMTQLSRV